MKCADSAEYLSNTYNQALDWFGLIEWVGLIKWLLIF